jgi:hypothetical protein
VTRRLDDRWLLPIEGLASGFLSCFQRLPLDVLGISGFALPGIIFGIALSAHMATFRGTRSVPRLIGFVATCALASFVSVFATVWTPLHPHFLDFSGGASGEIDTSRFFTGGLVGAAIVCAGAFFFVSPKQDLTKFLLKALSISLACGLLGVLGWSVGERLQAARSPPQFGGNLDFNALYVIWQTGAASLLALLL